MNQPERVIVTVPDHQGREDREYPGTVRHHYSDGHAYVVLDNGSQGSYPEDRLRPLEDKDRPQMGMEVK